MHGHGAGGRGEQDSVEVGEQESVEVGDRLKVYWPAEHQWYKGRVIGQDAKDASTTILYDDDDEQTYDTNTIVYETTNKHQEEEEDGDAQMHDREKFVLLSKANKGPPRRGRRVRNVERWNIATLEYRNIATHYIELCVQAQAKMGEDSRFEFRLQLSGAEMGNTEMRCGPRASFLRFLTEEEIATVLAKRYASGVVSNMQHVRDIKRDGEACIAGKIGKITGASAAAHRLSLRMQERARAFLQRYEYSHLGALSTHEAGNSDRICADTIITFSDQELTALVIERYGASAAKYLTTTAFDMAAWHTAIKTMSVTKKDAVRQLLAPVYAFTRGTKKEYETALGGASLLRHISAFLIHNFVSPALNKPATHVINVGNVDDAEDYVGIPTTTDIGENAMEDTVADLLETAKLLIAVHSGGLAPRLHGVAHYTPRATDDDLLAITYPLLVRDGAKDAKPCWGENFMPAEAVASRLDVMNSMGCGDIQLRITKMTKEDDEQTKKSGEEDEEGVVRFESNSAFGLEFDEVGGRYFGFRRLQISSTMTAEGLHVITGDYTPGHHLSVRGAAHERVADQYMRWWQVSRWCSDQPAVGDIPARKWITRVGSGDLRPLWTDAQSDTWNPFGQQYEVTDIIQLLDILRATAVSEERFAFAVVCAIHNSAKSQVVDTFDKYYALMFYADNDAIKPLVDVESLQGATMSAAASNAREARDVLIAKKMTMLTAGIRTGGKLFTDHDFNGITLKQYLGQMAYDSPENKQEEDRGGPLGGRSQYLGVIRALQHLVTHNEFTAKEIIDAEEHRTAAHLLAGSEDRPAASKAPPALEASSGFERANLRNNTLRDRYEREADAVGLDDTSLIHQSLSALQAYGGVVKSGDTARQAGAMLAAAAEGSESLGALLRRLPVHTPTYLDIASNAMVRLVAHTSRPFTSSQRSAAFLRAASDARFQKSVEECVECTTSSFCSLHQDDAQKLHSLHHALIRHGRATHEAAVQADHMVPDDQNDGVALQRKRDEERNREIRARAEIDVFVRTMCAGISNSIASCTDVAKLILRGMYDFELSGIGPGESDPPYAKLFMFHLAQFASSTKGGLGGLRAVHITTDTPAGVTMDKRRIRMQQDPHKHTTQANTKVNAFNKRYDADATGYTYSARDAEELRDWITRRIARIVLGQTAKTKNLENLSESDTVEVREHLASRIVRALRRDSSALAMPQRLHDLDARGGKAAVAAVARALRSPFAGSCRVLRACVDALHTDEARAVVPGGRGEMGHLEGLLKSVVDKDEAAIISAVAGGQVVQPQPIFSRGQNAYALSLVEMQQPEGAWEEHHPHALRLLFSYHDFDMNERGFQTPSDGLVDIMQERYGRQVDGIPRLACELKDAPTCSALSLRHVDDVMRMWTTRGIFSNVEDKPEGGRGGASFDPVPEYPAILGEVNTMFSPREWWLHIAQLENTAIGETAAREWSSARMARLVKECMVHTGAGYEVYRGQYEDYKAYADTALSAYATHREDVRAHVAIITHFHFELVEPDTDTGTAERALRAVRKYAAPHAVKKREYMRDKEHIESRLRTANEKERAYAIARTGMDVSQYNVRHCIERNAEEADDADDADDVTTGSSKEEFFEAVQKKSKWRVSSADHDIAESIYTSWNVTSAQRAVDLLVQWALRRVYTDLILRPNSPAQIKKKHTDAVRRVGRVFNRLRDQIRDECALLARSCEESSITTWVRSQWTDTGGLLQLFDADGDVMPFDDNHLYRSWERNRDPLHRKRNARRFSLMHRFAQFEKEFRGKLVRDRAKALANENKRIAARKKTDAAAADIERRMRIADARVSDALDHVVVKQEEGGGRGAAVGLKETVEKFLEDAVDPETDPTTDPSYSMDSQQRRSQVAYTAIVAGLADLFAAAKVAQEGQPNPYVLEHQILAGSLAELLFSADQYMVSAYVADLNHDKADEEAVTHLMRSGITRGEAITQVRAAATVKRKETYIDKINKEGLHTAIQTYQHATDHRLLALASEQQHNAGAGLADDDVDIAHASVVAMLLLLRELEASIADASTKLEERGGVRWQAPLSLYYYIALSAGNLHEGNVTLQAAATAAQEAAEAAPAIQRAAVAAAAAVWAAAAAVQRAAAAAAAVAGLPAEKKKDDDDDDLDAEDEGSVEEEEEERRRRVATAFELDAEDEGSEEEEEERKEIEEQEEEERKEIEEEEEERRREEEEEEDAEEDEEEALRLAIHYDDAQVALDFSTDFKLAKLTDGKYRYERTNTYGFADEPGIPREAQVQEPFQTDYSIGSEEALQTYYNEWAKPVKSRARPQSRRPDDAEGIIADDFDYLLSFRGTPGTWAADLLQFEMSLYVRLPVPKPEPISQGLVQRMSKHYAQRWPMSARGHDDVDDDDPPIYVWADFKYVGADTDIDFDSAWYSARRKRIETRMAAITEIQYGLIRTTKTALQDALVLATKNTMLLSRQLFGEFVEWKKRGNKHPEEEEEELKEEEEEEELKEEEEEELKEEELKEEEARRDRKRNHETMQDIDIIDLASSDGD